MGHKPWKGRRPLTSIHRRNPHGLSRTVPNPVDQPRRGERPPRRAARRVILVGQRQRMGQQHGRRRRPRRRHLHVTGRPRDRRGARGSKPEPDRVPPGGVGRRRRRGGRVVQGERGYAPDLDVVDVAQPPLPGKPGLRVRAPAAEVAAIAARDAGGGGAGGGRGRGGGGCVVVGGALPPGHREG